MKSQKIIHLTDDELKKLLRGTLLWSDISARLSPSVGARSGIRKLGTTQEDSPNENDIASYDYELADVHVTESGLRGPKVLVLLSFSGSIVFGLWLYYLIGA